MNSSGYGKKWNPKDFVLSTSAAVACPPFFAGPGHGRGSDFAPLATGKAKEVEGTTEAFSLS